MKNPSNPPKSKNKCEYADKCPMYSESCVTCNEDQGLYGWRLAGCFKYFKLKGRGK